MSKCHIRITESQAIEIMGSKEALCEALGVTDKPLTGQAVYRWPKPLSVKLTQQVIGAAWLLGRVRQINKVLGR